MIDESLFTEALGMDEEKAKAGLSKEFYGSVRMDMYRCALVKGVGKVPYDPQVHKGPPRTAIMLAVDPLPASGLTWSIERNMVDISPEWYRVVVPSLKDLGITQPAQIIGRWAKVIQVETGETYVDKNGETKAKTGIKFLAVYDSEDACTTAYLTDGGSLNAPAPTVTAPTNGNNQKAAMLPFLKAIVKNAARGQSDLTVIMKTVEVGISQFPQVAAVFTKDSPEVLTLLGQVMK